MGCVYCKKHNTQVELSVSDIIPDALTNNKILFNNVCEKKHNNDFSKEFEQNVIKELSTIRNRLLIFSSNRKGKIRAKFPAKVLIDDMTFETKISTKYDFFNSNPKYGKRSDGQGVLFVTQDNIDESKLSEIKKIDINNCDIHIRFNINHSIFYSIEIKRLIAKIGYEWYCKKTDKSYFNIIYNNIVDFIVNGTSSQDDIVKIVCDENVYNGFDNIIDVGGHALGVYYSSNGDVFVYVSLFNILIYRVTIYRSPIKFDFLKMINFYGNWADGVEVEFKIGITSGQGFRVCDAVSNNFVDKRIDAALDKIFSQHYFSIKYHKFLVTNLQITITSNDSEDIKFNKLLGFKDDETLIALNLLYILGKNIDLYNSDKSFNENLIVVYQTRNLYNRDEVFEKLKKLFYNNQLTVPFLLGCELFFSAYEKEIAKQKV